MSGLYGPHSFRLCGHGLELKTSLDANWRAKPFVASCVKPFLAKYNLKVSKSDPNEGREEFKLEGLKRVEIDGIEIRLPTAQDTTASVVPLKAEKVELFFGTPPPSVVKLCVGGNGIEFNLTLDAKWLKKTFIDAVVKPFVHMHNKRTYIKAEVAELLEVWLDKEPLKAEQLAAAKSCSSALEVLGLHTSRVDLFFSREAIAGAQKVKGLTAADGEVMAAELMKHHVIERLKEIYLYQNDLRDAGLIALSSALTKKRMPLLQQLHLGKNRIGDQGVIALAKNCDIHLQLLSLHSNEIGDDGCKALADAYEERMERTFDVDKTDLHTNQRISEVGRDALKRVRANVNYNPPDESSCSAPFIPHRLTAQRYIPGPWGDDKD